MATVDRFHGRDEFETRVRSADGPRGDGGHDQKSPGGFGSPAPGVQTTSPVWRSGWPDRTVTDLTGTVADQAALQGLLDRLYGRGFVLLGVELLSASDGVDQFASED